MTEPNPKPTILITKVVLDGCFRSFQSGMSPVDLVADLGVDPAIVKHCHELFLADPHAHGDRPGENGRLIVVLRKPDGDADRDLS